MSSLVLSLTRAGLLGAAAAGLLGSGTALAQPTVEQLQQEIQQRDKQIQQLLKRMDALEKEVRSRPATTTAAAPRQPAATAPAPAATALAPGAPPAMGAAPPPTAAAGKPERAAQAASPYPTPVQPLTGPAAPQPQSKEEAEEAMISRALENTLVGQGGQLLPPYMFQLVPDFSYTYRSIDQLAFVAPNGAIVRQQAHQNLLEWGFGFRIGLPWETQFSMRVPIGLDYGAATFAGSTNANTSAGGLGDISLTLQKQVLHERGWLPDVLLSMTYKANTGSTSLTQTQISTFPFTVGTGSGFNALSGGVTLLKRQDPLVFLGSFNYQHSFPNTINGVQQTIGDIYFFRADAILAASPDTSLRIGFLSSYQQQGSFNGRSSPGSNQQFSFVEFGVGSIITSKIYLDASLLVGLTRDSPDYTLLLSLPFRF